MAEHSFVTAPAGPPPHPAHDHTPAPPGATRERQGARTPTTGAVVVLRPWITSGTDHATHDARSRYVERCWLGVLGPSATWLLRRLNDELDAAAVRGDDAVPVDLVAIAREMGLAYTPGRESPFARAIQRCVMFDVAHHTADGLAVRRRLQAVPERFLRRLPPAVAREHDRWVPAGANGSDGATRGTDDDGSARRIRRIAASLAETGLSADGVEALLAHLDVDTRLAAAAVDELRRAAIRSSVA